MNIFVSILKTISFSLIVMWLAGCVQTKSVPGYAKAGDVLVLGLGGVHRNGSSESVISAEDLTITLTDSALVVHDLQALQTFKSYPEYSSTMNVAALTGGAAGLGVIAFDGGWFVTVPLTVPGDLSTPLTLTPGPATVSITSAKLTNTAHFVEGDLSAIPVEILAGTVDFDSSYADQFGYYNQSNDSFIINPGDLTGVDMVGGAYFVIDYADDSVFSAGLLPVVLPTNHNPYVQLSYNVKPNGDGTGSIYITLLNPAGFTTYASQTSGSALLADLSIKLLYFPETGLDANTFKANFSVDVASSYYIDVNGGLIPTLQPSMVHVVDL